MNIQENYFFSVFVMVSDTFDSIYTSYILKRVYQLQCALNTLYVHLQYIPLELMKGSTVYNI